MICGIFRSFYFGYNERNELDPSKNYPLYSISFTCAHANLVNKMSDVTTLYQLLFRVVTKRH